MGIKIIAAWALLGAAALAYSCGAPDQARGSTARRLRSVGFDVSVDGNGDLKTAVALENGRSQKVSLSSSGQKVGAWDVREVWSVAGAFPGGLPDGLSARLMADSWSSRVLGSWALAGPGSDGSVLLLYLVRIDARASARILRDAVHETASTADALESVLGDSDEF